MDYNERPLIDITLTAADKRLERLCMVLLTVLWAVVGMAYYYMPPNIPVQFNAHNQPVGVEAKVYIFLLPAFASLLYILLSIANKYPHKFNYLKPITTQNAESMYVSATRMLRMIKLLIVIGFFFTAADYTLLAMIPRLHGCTISLALEWIPALLVVGYVVFYLFSPKK